MPQALMDDAPQTCAARGETDVANNSDIGRFEDPEVPREAERCLRRLHAVVDQENRVLWFFTTSTRGERLQTGRMKASTAG